jgi:methylmalonyl-CoA mutase cobalamin-binding subunit
MLRSVAQCKPLRLGRVGSLTAAANMRRTTVTVITLLVAAHAGAQTSSCETLRSEIEAKIRASGVAEFTLSVVDAATAAPGKVVGTCDRGAKKVVYVQRAAVLTECKDGSVVVGSDCKKN